MNVANAPGSTVRADINNALGALVTRSSGTSEPATMFPYQEWMDTSVNLLKVRNAANTAWVIKGPEVDANNEAFYTANTKQVEINSNGDVKCNGTGALAVPAGTTAQRPSAVVGQIRYNSTTGGFEGYNGSSWGTIGAGVMPTGSIIAVAGSAAPSGGYLSCGGQAVSRTTYATLFAQIGTDYGVGDGSTTFNVPDMRGYVIAGRDYVVSSALGGRLIVTTSTTFTNTSNQAVVASAAGLAVGMYITGAGSGVSADTTTITAINGTTITMSAAATASLTVNTYYSPIRNVLTTGSQVGGSMTNTLGVDQTPLHTHFGMAARSGSTTALGAGEIASTSQQQADGASWSNANFEYTVGKSTNSIDRGLTSSSGGGQPHLNVQPTILMTYYIKT